MQIVKTSRFADELEAIMMFIAADSLQNALDFVERLNVQVMELVHMPYKYRASYYVDDENVRDMIFHGYVVPYRVNKEKERIEILGIFNQNEWQL